jgi:hypothetical protein
MSGPGNKLTGFYSTFTGGERGGDSGVLKRRYLMKTKSGKNTGFVLLALVACVLFFLCSTGPAAAGDGQKVKVMTQNLYVGADLDRISNAASFAEIPGVAASVHDIIMMSNFDERAEAIADQVAKHDPHLIGLQEVTLIRRQSPSDMDLTTFPPTNASPATEVELDFLDILLEKLADRGLDYYVAALVVDFDVEAPMVAFGPGGILLDDVRLTDHDVILARSDVEISNATGSRYGDFYVVAYVFRLFRGYAAVDATIGDHTFHVASTHLEVRGPESIFGGQAQFRQAQELLGILETVEHPIILMGDFNSAPVEGSDDTYNLITGTGPGEGGFVDIWRRGRNGRTSKGLTCCQDEFLLNSPSELYEHVDHIFLRNGLRDMPFNLVGPAVVNIVGDKEKDKTVSGLWPSDHAGVEATMIVPGLWDFE